MNNKLSKLSDREIDQIDEYLESIGHTKNRIEFVHVEPSSTHDLLFGFANLFVGLAGSYILKANQGAGLMFLCLTVPIMWVAYLRENNKI